MNHDGGAFIDADAEQFRMGGDHRDQIVLSMAGNHMLVNGGVLKQAEALNMWGCDHDGVVSIGISGRSRGSAHQKRALDRRSGRTASDHASSVEDSFDFAFGQSAKIGIRKPPLPSTLDPYSSGVA